MKIQHMSATSNQILLSPLVKLASNPFAADEDDDIEDDEIEDDEFDNKPKSKSNNQSLKSVIEDVNIDISDNKRNNVFNISDSATGQGNQLQSQIDNISESSNVPSSVNSGVPD